MSESGNAGKITAAFIAVAVVGVTPFAAGWEGDHGGIGYRDIGGVATDCFGHTKGAVVGRRYTAQQCQDQLSQDVHEHALIVAGCLKAEPPQLSFQAFVSFDMNEGAFCGSTINQRVNAGDLAGACKALNTGDDGKPRWAFVKDGRNADGEWRYRYVQGLANRRAAERKLCEQGIAEGVSA